MTLDEATRLLELIDSSAVRSEERRRVAASNRRAQAGLLIGNLELLHQLSDRNDTAALEAVASAIGNPT